MATTKEIENFRLRSFQDLCKLVETIGYRSTLGQYNNNGSNIGALADFIDDNPGVLEVIQQWILENHAVEEECCDDCGCPLDECECDKG